MHAAIGGGTMVMLEHGPKFLESTGLIKSAQTSILGTFASGAVIGAATENLNTFSQTRQLASFSQTSTAALSFGLTGAALHGISTKLGAHADRMAERSRSSDAGSIVGSLKPLDLQSIFGLGEEAEKPVLVAKTEDMVQAIKDFVQPKEAPEIENLADSHGQGWHIVLGSGGSKAALSGAGVVLAARAAEIKIDTIGGVSGGFVPAALAATEMPSHRFLEIAKGTDIAALLTQRRLFTQVVREHKPLDLLRDGIYDTAPLGQMVQSHMPSDAWPEKLWTMAVGGAHSEVVFTNKGVTEYSPNGQHILSNKAPSVGDAVRATSAIPGVLQSMEIYGRRLYDGALGHFGKCPADMAKTHFGIPEERIIASLPVGAMTTANAKLYRFAKYLSGNSEDGIDNFVEHAGIVVRPEVNSFRSMRFSLLPEQREDAILAGFRAGLEEFARNNLIKGAALDQARTAGQSMDALEAFFAPKNIDILPHVAPDIASGIDTAIAPLTPTSAEPAMAHHTLPDPEQLLLSGPKTT